VNVDDLGDHRPGQRAAAERGAVFPLVESGYSKADVRRDVAPLGLRTWDKPAAACLASRVPYGTPVTLGTLTTVARAESGLRASASASSGSVTTATWPASSSTPTRWPRRRPPLGGGRGRPPGRLPLRDARPRRVPVGQPERGPGRRVPDIDADADAGAAADERTLMIEVRVKLTFPEELVRQPLFARLVREYDVEPNIRRANVDDHEGWIVCEVAGEPAQIDGALAWLRDKGVRVDLLGDVVES
jgi:hypothetical protein